MPNVPTYDNAQVALNPISNAKQETIASPSMFSATADQTEALGGGLQDAGAHVSDIAQQMQMQANQVRVDDAMNQARQAALNLTYDPQGGYLSQKGSNALNRPNGQALPDEYAQKLQEQISNINGNLGNDAQKRLFSLQANSLATSFQGDVQKHMMGEYMNYALTTQDGTIKLGVDNAKLNWDQPDKVEAALLSVKSAVAKTGQLTGEPANETVAKMKAMESSVRVGVIDSALQNNNPTYALDYMNHYKDTMTADDILKVQGAVNRQIGAAMTLASVGATTQKYQNNFQPPDFSRLTNIAMGMESSGRDTNADGTPLTSDKGAKYKMQVMPDTAANPGHGIKPAQSDTPAEYNRVGTQLLGALVTKYGDAAKALAAYNAGEGNVDNAIADAKKSGGNWLDALSKYQSPENHAQTVGYVTKGVNQFESGLGAPPMPTKMDFVSDAISRLPPNPRVEWVQQTREQAEKQYDLILASRKEQGDNMEHTAQQAIIANGGDFTNLDPQIKSNLARFDPQRYASVEKFAKTVGRGDQPTNMAAFNFAQTNPDVLAGMSDSDFLKFQKENFSTVDQEKVAKLRADQINGKTDNSTEAINTKAMNTTLNNRLTAIGINPNPARTDDNANAQLGTIRHFVSDSIFQQQQQTGKKMTPMEVDEHIDKLMTKDAAFRSTFMGITTGTSSMKMMTMKAGDIPSDSMDALKQNFKANGMPNPTDDQLLRAYWKWKGSR